MLNRINQSLTEKKENLTEEPKYDEQKYEDLWNKTMFNDSEFWFLKTGSCITHSSHSYKSIKYTDITEIFQSWVLKLVM